MSKRPGSIVVPGGVSSGTRGCSVLCGTSGYSYTEWIDSGFYPPGTQSAKMLDIYGRMFSVVELNYTWYQMARAEPLSRMVARAPANVLFAAKLTRTMTHERDDSWKEQLKLYRQGIKVLRDRLVAVLVQLPPDFDRTTANRCYLANLLDGLNGLPVAVEFRHNSWVTDTVFKELEKRRVSLVTVDEPRLAGLFPPLDVVTNPDLFYVRFHGRNKSGWRSSNMQKKFDYDYSVEELQQWCSQWLDKLAVRANRGVVFFNNHVRAQAPGNASRLLELLHQRNRRTS